MPQSFDMLWQFDDVHWFYLSFITCHKPAPDSGSLPLVLWLFCQLKRQGTADCYSCYSSFGVEIIMSEWFRLGTAFFARALRHIHLFSYKFVLVACNWLYDIIRISWPTRKHSVLKSNMLLYEMFAIGVWMTPHVLVPQGVAPKYSSTKRPCSGIEESGFVWFLGHWWAQLCSLTARRIWKSSGSPEISREVLKLTHVK